MNKYSKLKKKAQHTTIQIKGNYFVSPNFRQSSLNSKVNREDKLRD